MRFSLPSFATTIVLSLVVVACASAASSSPTTTPTPATSQPATTPPRTASPSTTTSPPTASPPTTSEPIGTPIAAIDHATGSTNIVLRFDNGLGDYGICELCGGWGEFTPGPEFTLYGDGTVIFRNELAQPPPIEGGILRGSPFRIVRLDARQVQSLLRFALGEGGLANARGRYDTATDTDDPGYSTFTVRAGGLDKDVEVVGSNNPFGPLVDHLRHFGRGGNIPTQVWESDRFRGLLIEVSSWIGHGVLPDVPDTAVAPWPWPGLSPDDFVGPGAPSTGRRVMSAADAAALRLSDNGGVVQRIYLREPGGETIYSFSLWPVLPDEAGSCSRYVASSGPWSCSSPRWSYGRC